MAYYTLLEVFRRGRLFNRTSSTPVTAPVLRRGGRVFCRGGPADTDPEMSARLAAPLRQNTSQFNKCGRLWLDHLPNQEIG